MAMQRRLKVGISVVTLAGAAGAALTILLALPHGASAGQSGVLDDGKDLLPQAGITLSQAIAAAQAGGDGAVGEVDLEHWQGTLVFNVDVGNTDVKVDAATGVVLGTTSDD